MDQQQTQMMETLLQSAPITKLFNENEWMSLSSFTNQVFHPETIHWLPVGFLCLWFGVYVLASVLHNFILPFSLGKKVWKSCEPHQRTMVIYIISIILTTIAFVLQLIASPIFALQFSKSKVDCVRGTACIVAVLYLFELTYREKMRIQMLAHHIITVFISSFVLIMLDRTNDPSFILTGNLWLFQATAEQTTFLALFMYRIFSPAKLVRTLLYISSIQSLIVKMASTIGTVYVYVRWQIGANYQLFNPTQGHQLQLAWDSIFWIAIIGLSVTQFWGSWVLYVMGRTIEKRYQKKNEEKEFSQQQQKVPIESINTSSSDSSDLEKALPILSNRSSIGGGMDTPSLEKETFYELPIEHLSENLSAFTPKTTSALSSVANLNYQN